MYTCTSKCTSPGTLYHAPHSQVAYLGSLLGLSIAEENYLYLNSTTYQEVKLDSTTASVPETKLNSAMAVPDTMVATFCMIHVLVWMIVGVMDRWARKIQW